MKNLSFFCKSLLGKTYPIGIQLHRTSEGDDGDTVMWRDPVVPSEKVLGSLEIVKP